MRIINIKPLNYLMLRRIYKISSNLLKMLQLKYKIDTTFLQKIIRHFAPKSIFTRHWVIHDSSYTDNTDTTKEIL